MLGLKRSGKDAKGPAGPEETENPPSSETGGPDAFSTQLNDARQATYRIRRELLSLSDALAGELEGTVGQVEADGQKMNATSADLATAIGDVHALAEQLEQNSSQMSANAAEMSAAAESLGSTSATISERVGSALARTEEAVRKMEEATEVVRNLSQASSKIGDIVKLIQDIANQTNLLALNATIEAARAGEAGRGFAVVANEVKALAGQTANATTEIADQIGSMQGVTDAAVAALSQIGDAISGVQSNSNEVSHAVEQQHQAISSIGRIASETEGVSQTLGESVSQVARKAADAEGLGGTQKSTADAMADGIAALGQRLNVAIAATRQSNNGTSGPIPFPLHASIQSLPEVTPCELTNLTGGTATLVFGGATLAPGTVLKLNIPAIGQAQATVRGASGDGYSVEINQTPGFEQALAAFEAKSIAPDQPVIALAADAAEQIRSLFQAAVDEGTLSVDDLFDENYQAVDGSNPTQHLTRFTDFTDRELPAIQEPALELHDAVIFCAAVDRNGYLPTHNLKYCHPQKPDDPVWNAANCRNHRIFSDRTGLAAGRNTEPFLVQSYLRDMGGGNYVLMKDLSVPITISGKHWGGFRVGYKL